MRAVVHVSLCALALLVGCAGSGNGAHAPKAAVSGATTQTRVCPADYPILIEARGSAVVPAKARVVIAGLEIGRVAAQSREVSTQHMIVCLRSGIDVYANATLSRHTSSMLGDIYLELDPGGPEKVAKDGARMPVEKLQPGGAVMLLE